MSGFSKEYARKRGGGGMKMDENQPSELKSPINKLIGSTNILYAKLCVFLCRSPHVYGKCSQLSSDP